MACKFLYVNHSYNRNKIAQQIEIKDAETFTCPLVKWRTVSQLPMLINNFLQTR